MPEVSTLDLRVDETADAMVGRLRSRLHGPLCGLMPTLGFMPTAGNGLRACVSAADLTGVHVLRGTPRPRIGAYHIGGVGTTRYESTIRSLGETTERYAVHVADRDGRFPVRFAPHREAVRDGSVLPLDWLTFFTEDQLRRPGFPFEAADAERPIGWIEVDSIVDGTRWAVPAQQFLVGYQPRRDQGEPWLVPAVTTGTAAHRTYAEALLNGLQEIVQIDAALGHWYGRGRAVAIEADARTAALDRVVARMRRRGSPEPRFFLLPSADLPGFSVACVLHGVPGVVPAVAVGLGSESGLARAMYKSLLEAIGVHELALWRLVSDTIDGAPVGSAVDLDQLYDLDTNVGYYATREGAQLVLDRFAAATPMTAGDLPPDDVRPVAQRVASTVEAFRSTGKQLFVADLTTVDVRAAGFVVARAWSPHTLSLTLPSAPAAAHPRFAAYGGFTSDEPHPYP